ncbi:uncharacterized protein si:ch73-264p11.1 [Betta splendens]|uniref:Uncharacterized protein si:ch73-264p11.1 n=1 Tax=Betta splendens TaxID=158456 RepID=A0A6P7M9H8_BETSP|nr:uncharacterized protein si:ch73-264p11.1 [Betta splendens]
MAAALPMCYHGAITKDECEALLGKKNRDGAYLIRDSETIQGAMCLCVYKKKVVYTYRILQNLNGHFTLLTAGGLEETFFKSLEDLIHHYKRKNQGLAIHLRHSIKRKRSLLIQPQRMLERQPEPRPPEPSPPEPRQSELRPPDRRPPEPRPSEPRQPEPRLPELRPPDRRPPELRPPDRRPPELRPPDRRPPELRPPDRRPPEPKPPDRRPPEHRPPDLRSPYQRPSDPRSRAGSSSTVMLPSVDDEDNDYENAPQPEYVEVLPNLL